MWICVEGRHSKTTSPVRVSDLMTVTPHDVDLRTMVAVYTRFQPNHAIAPTTLINLDYHEIRRCQETGDFAIGFESPYTCQDTWSHYFPSKKKVIP